MEAFLREHCLAPRTFWFKLMTCKHHAPYLNMWTIALHFDVCNNTSVTMLQDSADIITDWSRHNDMRINATKTKEIIYVSVVMIIMLHLFRVLL